MSEAKQTTTCFHCGEDCIEEHIVFEQHDFCCQGCRTVYSLLNETGLNTYYDIERNPGPTVKDSENSNEFLNLDEVKGRLLDFTEGNQSKITLYLPSVHCAACIWLLERLERLNKGVIKSEVNFIRKEVTVIFNHDIISLKDLVDLLESLMITAVGGYFVDRSGEKITSKIKK